MAKAKWAIPILVITMFIGGCDSKNKVQNSGATTGGYTNPIYGGSNPGSVGSLSCRNSGYNPSGSSTQRYPANFHILNAGSYSTIQGTLQPGHTSGSTIDTFVGVSAIGDFIYVYKLNSGAVNITFDMCEYYPLIYSGRQVQYAQMMVNAMVVNSRPDCQVNEVTSGNFRLTVPAVTISGSQLPSVQFDISFFRPDGVVPGICN